MTASGLLAAGGTSEALAPGVTCVFEICTNNSDFGASVTGYATCPDGTAIPVTAFVPAHGMGVLQATASCADGSKPGQPYTY
ncbi:hypothetical protein [Aldersonia kunmingensis]|uniref:hypothetical protein n=1 Tax=Aldersonia kunmingensis TaxID=408066 RepID=UPI000834AC93|nr:hypothetical protein [Aldersonia kunmingensis]